MQVCKRVVEKVCKTVTSHGHHTKLCQHEHVTKCAFLLQAKRNHVRQDGSPYLA